MVVIDSDGHVEESVAMFEHIEPQYYGRRPLALGFDENTAYGPFNAVWLIDGKVFPNLHRSGSVAFATPTMMEAAKRKPVSIAAQELADVQLRLNDLDKLGIDKQVIFPTMFLATIADDVKLEAALMRAYNTFLGKACAQSEGRLAFAALVPIRDLDESQKEMQRARELGAVAAVLLGVAWDKGLGDKTLYPFYEQAADLGIPIVVHFGWGCPAITDAFTDVSQASDRFRSAIMPVLTGFHSIMSSGVLDRFPGLRFAFLETGSNWLPYLIHQLRRGHIEGDDPSRHFREGRVYVGCEADEDINYLISWIGEDSLVTGSDYPHADPFHEENMVKAIMGREDVPLRVREKILTANPSWLYGM